MTTATYRLAANADTTHEDARDWYGSYGWHISTEQEGDVTHEAVEFDWLDNDDVYAEQHLSEIYDGLTTHEIESIVAKAREIREAGEAVESLLAAAVEAYQRGDLAGVVEALADCERVESEHGDSPASQALHAELLEEVEEE